MDYVTYYLFAGFVLAVIADGFNMWKEWTTGVLKPETRFGLADTVFVMFAWPIVLWASIKELRNG